MRAVVICPDQEVSLCLQEMTAEITGLAIARTVNHYPNELNLVRIIRAVAPQVIFLSIESMDTALEIASFLAEKAPGLHLVALSRSRDPGLLENLIRSEIREILAFPFDRQNVVEAMTRAGQALARKAPGIGSTDRLFSFLPAKAGVGASTIALNSSVALAELPDINVLLCDFDLSSGLIQFMLKLTHLYSVVDAALRAEELDENMWPELVHSMGRLDILHSGEFHPGLRMEMVQLRELLDFARRHYSVICADLSGNMEEFSVEIMRESKRIFLVSTPQMPALHLARKKLNFLKSQDLGDRVSLLLNRPESDKVVPIGEIEELVGVPVLTSFPNDYSSVRNALSAGKPLDRDSLLGARFGEMARLMLDRRNPSPRERPQVLAGLSNWLFARAGKKHSI